MICIAAMKALVITLAVLSFRAKLVYAQGPPPAPTSVIADLTISIGIPGGSAGYSIDADDVTVDCEMNEVKGLPFVPGIRIDNRKGITIKNCIFSQFLHGIQMHASSVTLQNVALIENTANGLDANDHSRVLISAGTLDVVENGVFGILLQNGVTMTMIGADVRAENNEAAGIQVGIQSSVLLDQVSPGPGTLPSSILAKGNAFFGMTLTSNSNLVLFGTTTVNATNNGSNGITVFSGSSMELDRDATVISQGNTLNGILVEDGSIGMFSIDPTTLPVLNSTNNGKHQKQWDDCSSCFDLIRSTHPPPLLFYNF